MDGGAGSASYSAAQELAELLGLAEWVSADELKRGFRAEMKRLHPDTGTPTLAEVERLTVLLAAYERYNDDKLEQSADGGGTDRPNDDSADEPPPPWFTPSPRGPEPRPRFWRNR